MKTTKSIITYLIAIMITIGITSVKELNGQNSLYKTDEGKEAAHNSYDEALSLFEVETTEEYIETDYGKTHVLVAGAEGGQPLFILPGLFGDASMWYANIKDLSKEFRVYVFDMPNYGGKSQPSDLKINELEDYKTWFNQLLTHYKLKQVSMVGISYSSWLTLALTREMPEKFTSIILLDPSETFMPMNGGIAWKGFKYFMFFPNRTKYAKFLDWLGGGYSDEKLALWRKHMLDVIEFGSTKMFDVPQHRIFKPEELGMVQMPVLIIAGGKPILYKDPEEFKVSAQNSLPHAKVVIVPDSGHGLNMEKPEIVNSQIIKFLHKNRSLSDTLY